MSTSVCFLCFFFDFFSVCPLLVWVFLFVWFLGACLFSNEKKREDRFVWVGKEGGSKKICGKGNHDLNILYKNLF